MNESQELDEQPLDGSDATTKNTKLCRFSKFLIPDYSIVANRAFTSNNMYLIVYVETYAFQYCSS